MKVLVACEYSGVVREAFRKRGHDAYSCDLLPSEIDGQHLIGDVLNYLDQGWELMIAHPPCTALTVAGNRWYANNPEAISKAYEFVQSLAAACIRRIAIENPIGRLSTLWRKPDQIIYPWMFGDSYSKSTCLWLKNLPKLVPTDIADKGEFVIHGGKKLPKWYSNREFSRDRTFQGIANAMALQWG